MKIGLISNTHNELQSSSLNWIIKLLGARVDAFALVGGIASSSQLERVISPLLNSKKLIMYVDGNTDHYYSSIREGKRIYRDMESRYLNFKYFDDEYKLIYGKVVYGGCGWTDFNGNERAKWDCADKLDDCKKIVGLKGITGVSEMGVMHRRFRTGLLNPKFDKVDLVLSHFTPITKPPALLLDKTDPMYDYYYGTLAGAMQRKQVKLWLHGHDGSREECITNTGTKVVSNCKGMFTDNTYAPTILEL